MTKKRLLYSLAFNHQTLHHKENLNVKYFEKYKQQLLHKTFLYIGV